MTHYSRILQKQSIFGNVTCRGLPSRSSLPPSNGGKLHLK